MRHGMRLIGLLLIISLLSLSPFILFACAEGEVNEIVEDVLLDDAGEEETYTDENPDVAESVSSTARDAFISDIIALGKELYDKADGKLQRAHYKGDIYVCKNFTVYVFRQTRDKYRMAEYPDVQLKIPNNLPAEKCKPHAYGYCWEEIAASDGNPFEEAAQFL